MDTNKPEESPHPPPLPRSGRGEYREEVGAWKKAISLNFRLPSLVPTGEGRGVGASSPPSRLPPRSPLASRQVHLSLAEMGRELRAGPHAETILWSLRLPRILLAALVGASAGGGRGRVFKRCCGTSWQTRIFGGRLGGRIGRGGSDALGA